VAVAVRRGEIQNSNGGRSRRLTKAVEVVAFKPNGNQHKVRSFHGGGRFGAPAGRRVDHGKIAARRARPFEFIRQADVGNACISGRSTAGTFRPGAQRSLWSRNFACEERNGDQHDAYSAAAWMRRADLDGSLAAGLNPSLATPERAVAQVEGWILGVA